MFEPHLAPLPIALVASVAACAFPTGDHAADIRTVTDAELADVEPDNQLIDECRSLTITGRVFYNDQRRFGRFRLRRDPEGNPGTREYYGSGDFMNYLALREGQVDLFEASDDDACDDLAPIATVQIDRDGRFLWSGELCGCDGAPQIAAQISLRNCSDPDERCFKVTDPEGAPSGWDHYDLAWSGQPWQRWHRGASDAAPAAANPLDATLDLGDDYFQEIDGRLPVGHLDYTAQAANVFASMVDVTRAVHLRGGIDFDHATYGEIEAAFPDQVSGNSHSHQASKLCIVEPTEWIDGDVPAHEYGHLVHYQAWDGVGKWTDYCYGGDCDSARTGHEYAITAFKEGWAEMVRDVTFDAESTAPTSCAKIDDEPAIACHGPDLCPDGRHVVREVEHTLCDLWDAVGDCTTQWGGDDCDDAEAVDLAELREVLWWVWITASADERDDVRSSDRAPEGATAALGLCRYINTYIDLHPSRESELLSALTRNGISCAID